MQITVARKGLAAWLALVAIGTVLAAPMLVAAQTAEDPSDVVLVFDVSNSILLSEDGTNVAFAAALDGIADRVAENADELAIGNAEISFVVFGRQATTYRNRCVGLALRGSPAAIAALERCLRDIAAEYRAGADAPVRQRLNTQDTDHVAALRAAAELLPDETTRSAVVFFTDGAHDPPGTTRDDEDVVAEVEQAFEGQTPLAILPVGLGAGAGAFENQLRALYTAYFRDMEPCEGRTTFDWPEVVFEAAEEAGVAVAEALQEVTCSFTFVPTPTATPTPEPTATPPPPPGVPLNVQLLAGDRSLTVQWVAPADTGAAITDYRVVCTPEAGGQPVEATVEATATTEAELTGLTPGERFRCIVTAMSGDVAGPASEESEPVVVLGLPAAPGQPRVEVGDAAARVSVDAVAGGAPAEQYAFECRDTGGAVAGSAIAQGPSAVVQGLTNGRTFDCVAYAENRIGRSPASVASVRFTPCGGFFDCNPWAKWTGAALVLVATLAALWYVSRRYGRRNRVWITAQVDGGDNRSLGWGPEIGIRLEQDEAGWFAALRPFEGSDIRARYRGGGRFLINSKAGIRDVHQGDPAPVRDESGLPHELILRNYRDRPKQGAGAPAPSPAPSRRVRRGKTKDAAVDSAAAEQLGSRIEGRGATPPPDEVDPAR